MKISFSVPFISFVQIQAYFFSIPAINTVRFICPEMIQKLRDKIYFLRNERKSDRCFYGHVNICAMVNRSASDALLLIEGISCVVPIGVGYLNKGHESHFLFDLNFSSHQPKFLWIKPCSVCYTGNLYHRREFR